VEAGGGEEGSEERGEEKEGRGAPRFRKPNEGGAKPPGKNAGARPRRHSDGHGEEDREDARLHGDARSVDHAREHVAPEVVRAEEMRRARSLPDRAPVLAQGTVGGDPGGAHAKHHVEDNHPRPREAGGRPRPPRTTPPTPPC